MSTPGRRDDATTAASAVDGAPGAAQEGAPAEPLPAPGTAATPRPGPVPPAVQAAAAWSWRIIVILAAVALGVWGLAVLKVIVVPVAIALLLTVLLSPLVRALQRWLRLPRAAASGIAVVLLLGLVAGLLTLAGQSIVNGVTELWDQASDGVTKLVDWLSEGPLHLGTADIDEWITQLQDAAASSADQIASGALSVGVTVGHVAAGTLIALFCTLFFLIDGRGIWAWLVGLLPRGSR